ncbi:MAG: hypothetical protein ACK48Y_10410, partial [Planctomyces sp.]
MSGKSAAGSAARGAGSASSTEQPSEAAATAAAIPAGPAWYTTTSKWQFGAVTVVVADCEQAVPSHGRSESRRQLRLSDMGVVPERTRREERAC